MAFLLETVLVLTAVAVFLLYRWATGNDGYWQKRGVPSPPTSPFFGTLGDMIYSRKSMPDFFRGVYERFPGSPYVGLTTAGRPELFVRDPELVKLVLAKDFEFFPDRGNTIDEKLDPLSGHLFNLEGVRWKSLRIKLTPTFTSGKMRRMYPLMRECSGELGGVLEGILEGAAPRGEEVDFKDLLARFSTDVIGTCAFGFACNSLKDPKAEFRWHGEMIFKPSAWTLVRALVHVLFPRSRLNRWLFQNTPFGKFFLRVLTENLQFREKQQTKRNDFLDMLIELKNKGRIVDDAVDVLQDPFLRIPVLTSSEEFKFTNESLAAQAFIFFLAGFETSSSAMSFCLLELAMSPEIQTKVHNEIDAVLKKQGDFTYEALSEMTYLDKVIAETLRKYPPLAVMMRKAVKPYRLPDSDVVLEKGTTVYIPTFALHYDPAIYPEPERFDPERFSAEARASRHPYAYLPFGEGPRICIGQRFGLLQTKLGLVSVLRRCCVAPSTSTQYPVKFKKVAFITTPEAGFNLTVRQRERAHGPDTTGHH